jgi:hypothetical protein
VAVSPQIRTILICAALNRVCPHTLWFPQLSAEETQNREKSPPTLFEGKDHRHCKPPAPVRFSKNNGPGQTEERTVEHVKKGGYFVATVTLSQILAEGPDSTQVP